VSAEKSAINSLYHLTYRFAYLLMRAYWRVLHPPTHGALVAIWYEGQILLVRNSYVGYYSLPGGYVRREETGRHAALRELAEETGVHARPDDLKQVVDLHHRWEGKREHLEIFELHPPARPGIEIDGREVIDAAFFAPERALELDLFPPIRQVIERQIDLRPSRV
jgi:ADP-ribose pyrophosphatase YjhB (NUDIX family)